MTQFFSSKQNLSRQNLDKTIEDLLHKNIPLSNEPIINEYDEKIGLEKRLLGNEAIKKSDFQTALQFYTQSINADNTVSQTFSNRALVYIKINKYDEALKDCEKALKLDPENIKASFRKGQSLMKLSLFSEALKTFTYLLSHSTTSMESIQQNINECYHNLCNSEVNLNIFNSSSVYHPIPIAINDDDLNANKTNIKSKESKNGSKNEIEDDGDSDLDIERSKQEGNLAFNEKNYEKAYHLYTLGIKRCEQHMDEGMAIYNENIHSILLVNRSKIFEKWRRFASSLADLSNACKINPKNAKAFYLQAKCLYTYFAQYGTNAQEQAKQLLQTSKLQFSKNGKIPKEVNELENKLLAASNLQ